LDFGGTSIFAIGVSSIAAACPTDLTPPPIDDETNRIILLLTARSQQLSRAISLTHHLDGLGARSTGWLASPLTKSLCM